MTKQEVKVDGLTAEEMMEDEKNYRVVDYWYNDNDKVWILKKNGENESKTFYCIVDEEFGTTRFGVEDDLNYGDGM